MDQVKTRIKKLIEQETREEVLNSVESILTGSSHEEIPDEILQALDYSRKQNSNLTPHTSARDFLKK